MDKKKTQNQSPKALAWKRFRSNKLGMVSCGFVLIWALLALFAYLVIPDKTPNANRQILEISTKKPGFEVDMLMVPKETPPAKTPFFQLLFSGRPDDCIYLPFDSFPVINGLTDFAHPCQVLADLMTVREVKGRLDGLKLCFIGDGNNMMNSLIVGALKCGMKVAVACPEGYEPDRSVIEFAAQVGGFEMYRDPRGAARAADVVITDVWASMGQEEEAAQRRAIFAGFQINDEVMKYAKSDAMVLHCLPAHRGEEITAAMLEAHANEIFEEAENRLHAQKAVLVKLLSNDK